jgi:hypothetical protein
VKKYSGLLYSLSIVTLILPCVFSVAAYAQHTDSVSVKPKHKWKVKTGSYYGSWGYNEETYTNSNIYVNQPSQNNNFVYNNVQAQDHIGWDHLFSVQPTIPQYNYRFGYFFNEKQDLAIELNFDHTKYIVLQGYNIIVSGTLHGHSVDTTVYLSDATLRYFLNNGANFFLFNLVKKISIFSTHDKNFIVDGLLKAGVGPLVPHVDNEIFGMDNRKQFQLGGWNTGIEATIKFTFGKHVYLEYCNKVDYARYSWLEVYQGRAHQNFGTYENIANIGYTLHIYRRKPKNLPVQPEAK